MHLITALLYHSESARSQGRWWLVGGLLLAFLVATTASVSHVHTTLDGDSEHSVAYDEGSAGYERFSEHAIAELLSGGHYCELCLYLDLLDHGQPLTEYKPQAIFISHNFFSHYDSANAFSRVFLYQSRAPPLAA